MKLDNYIQALTAGLAAMPARRLQEVAAPSGISLDQPRAPGMVSIAGKGKDALEGFTAWLARLPPQVPRDVRTWIMETLHAPSFAFSPADFIALIDAQKPRDAVWARLAALVRESNELNGEPLVEPEGLRSFLLSAGDWWGLMADQLLQEAQIECLVEGSEFVVPEPLAALFVPLEPFFADEEERFFAYLYPTRTVTVAELTALVEAQGRPERLGQALAKEIEETFSDFQGQDVSDGLGWLRSKTDEDGVEHLVCRSICRICEEARENPVIPAPLADAFGPDERDQKRAQFRSRVSGGGWVAAQNPSPWSCYVWEPIPDQIPNEVPLDQAAAGFDTALDAIAAFAAKHESPFAEAFRLARFCLNRLEPGRWDDAHEAALGAQLRGEGFTDMALDVFSNQIFPVRELARLDWPGERLGFVLAAAVADVFGGMGSWNDQDFGEAYEAYGKVSSALAHALGTVWNSLLAPWGNHGLS